MSERTSIYPASRWFRETVLQWLDAHYASDLRHRVDDLFTRIADAQPPSLQVIDGGKK